MELPLVWLMLLPIVLWQMELPLWLMLLPNMADGIAINCGCLWKYNISHTPEEAMSGGLAKACVPSKI